MIVEQKVRVLGLQMAQNNFYGGQPSNTIWADCIKCDLSIIATFADTEAARSYTDKQARVLFKSYGWTILPTLCPKCQENLRRSS